MSKGSWVTNRSDRATILTRVSSSKTGGRSAALPIIREFPGLMRVPRVALGRFFTPIVRLDSISSHLWIKRDDLCGDPLGGNKVRALEFLLAGLEKDETVVT